MMMKGQLCVHPAGPGVRLVALATLALALMLGTGGAAQAAGGNSDLAISNAWMRIVIAERPAAGYFTLTNKGARAVELTGAASPDCSMVMLHQSREQSGVETMAMIDQIKVPAHGSIRFAPGGYHLMCMKPAASMKPGASVPMTLRFKDGTSLKAAFAVRNAMGK